MVWIPRDPLMKGIGIPRGTKKKSNSNHILFHELKVDVNFYVRCQGVGIG